MSLVPDYEDSNSSTDSTSSNSDSGSSLREEKAKISDVQKEKLPAPNFSIGDVEGKHSVFKNPFTEAENAKEALLQKHVKMVETKDNTKLINGRKICWNYRKGRCRFGHNCKYAHDSDVQKTEEQIQQEKNVAIQNSVVCQNNMAGNSLNEDNKKRKRPGLTRGLIPGKKVMKQYVQNKNLISK